MEGSYPKYLFKKDGEKVIEKLVATPEAHEALERADPGLWAEGPDLFDARGRAVHRPDPPPEASAGPASTAGEKVEYPKWLYHRDGKRAQVIETKEAHDALIDRGDWLEDLDLSAAQRANSVASSAPPGESLWETPVRDVVEMLRGASLPVLEKTFALEEKNPQAPGGRRTLLRELSDMIEQAQKAANADLKE